jgi:hypothetical protein
MAHRRSRESSSGTTVPFGVTGHPRSQATVPKCVTTVQEWRADQRKAKPPAHKVGCSVWMFSLYDGCYGEPKVRGQRRFRSNMSSHQSYRSTQGRCNIALAQLELTGQQAASAQSVQTKSTGWSSHIDCVGTLAKLRGGDDWKTESRLVFSVRFARRW